MRSPRPSVLYPVPWFLATSPSANPEMVERTTVSDLLDRCTDRHRATIVQAPAGFGKTVAVSQWAIQRQQAEPGAMSWLTLSDGIRDSSDLLRALLTALQHTARERHDAAFHRDLAAVYECGTFRRGVAALRAISCGITRFITH